MRGRAENKDGYPADEEHGDLVLSSHNVCACVNITLFCGTWKMGCACFVSAHE
jgi:hypothetical protein